MSKRPPQGDLETVIHALVAQLKHQSVKVPQQPPAWVERHLGVPTSLPESIWRLCWLTVIPAIAAYPALLGLSWLWGNALPWLVILISVSVGAIYYAVYLFASVSAHDKRLQRLVDIQLAIPPLVMAGVFFWEVLQHGTL